MKTISCEVTVREVCENVVPIKKSSITSRNQLLLEPPVTEPIPCNIIDKKNINYILMLFKQFQVFKLVFFYTFFNFYLGTWMKENITSLFTSTKIFT